MSTTIAIFLAAWLALVSATPAQNCDEQRCLGPLKLYKDLGCKPVYKEPNDCCPMRYDCDHFKTRSSDKCHAFGKEYNVGDEVQSESGGIGCFPSCRCIKDAEDKVGFTCALALPSPPEPECYRPRNATECHAGPDVCFDKPEDVPTCQVGEKTIKAGEYFSPEDDPKKACWCGPGYNGENVAPFCKDTTSELCGAELHNKWEIDNNCAPVFDVTQDGATDCNYQWRCHEKDDKVMSKQDILTIFNYPEASEPSPTEPEMQCKFGNITMRIDDVVSRVVNDECIFCMCQVPPALSCLRTVKNVCLLDPEFFGP